MRPTMTGDAAFGSTHSPQVRIARNIAWFLGGKGLGAVFGIAAIAIMAHALGLEGFGHFSLIVAGAQALGAVVGLQTWRAVVRHGAQHVEAGNRDALARLGMLATGLDVIGAVLGTTFAAAIFLVFPDRLGLDPAYADVAFWFTCAVLWALASTPAGIVRALHRLEVSVYVEAVVPTGRLAMALVVWAIGPSVGRFLIGWALIELVEAVCYWTMARQVFPGAIRLSHLRDVRRTLAENPGLGRFLLLNHAAGMLGAAVCNGPLLAVGGLIGPAAAGLYRLAAQLAQALSRMAALLTRIAYLELARTRVASARRGFARIALQTSVIAGSAGVIVVLLAVAAGRSLLAILGGAAFGAGVLILVPLAIAASLEASSAAFESVLHAAGRARLALVARVLAVATLFAAMWFLLPVGPSGAAWAATLAGIVSYMAMGLMALASLAVEEEPGPLDQTEIQTPDFAEQELQARSTLG